MRLARIMPTTVQAWVTQALASGPAPRSVSKYHVMLHAAFARAVRDRIISFNPCENTELPKFVLKQRRILTPAEFETVLATMPARFKPVPAHLPDADDKAASGLLGRSPTARPPASRCGDELLALSKFAGSTVLSEAGIQG
ncbi:MAG: hypothetical protein ACOH2F_09450 [Cellulomonas sp.]